MISRQDEGSQADAQDPPSPILVDQEPLPEPEPLDPIREAEQVKGQGNELFKAGKLLEAVEKYTRAIGTYRLLHFRAHEFPYSLVMSLVS